jgi:hypothetical protein
MKRILPILTAALALVATTASAINYYDYYEDATSESSSITYYIPEWNTNVTASVETIDYGNYQIVRTAYPYQPLYHHDSLYKIRVTGESVDLYIADWIDNVGDSFQEDSLKSKGIAKYGYYYVNTEQGEKIDISKATPFEIEKSPWNDNYVTRYGYYLGTFNAGDEIEIYMEDSNGGSARSNSTMWQDGAYGEGVDNVDHLELLKKGYYDPEAENLDWNAKHNIFVAAQKAMPLAALDTAHGNHRVFFTIYGEGSSVGTGSPLPGGLPVVLAAGVFAFGFWFVRRRKAAAA